MCLKNPGFRPIFFDMYPRITYNESVGKTYNRESFHFEFKKGLRVITGLRKTGARKYIT
jgi:hypothetical protein